MKAAIVTASALTKHRRWDADYYLGMVENREYRERIRTRLKQIRTLQKGLRELRKQAQAHEERVDAMIAAGEVVPLTSPGKLKRKRKHGIQLSTGAPGVGPAIVQSTVGGGAAGFANGDRTAGQSAPECGVGNRLADQQS